MNQYTIELTDKKTIAKDVFELTFTKPVGFVFSAGQFVQFLIPHEGKIQNRSYSISSTPADPTLQFCVKKVENGLGSAFFEHMNVGDSADVKGPLGRFVINNETEKHTFIATGVGLAPIMGMIRDELKNKKHTTPLHLIFGVRTTSDIFWAEELEELNSLFPHFTYTTCLTQADESWSGAQGRVTTQLTDIDSQTRYYVCGSAQMVLDVKNLLTQKDVPVTHIHFEIF